MYHEARSVVVMSPLLGVLGVFFNSLEKDEGLCQSHKENIDENDTINTEVPNQGHSARWIGHLLKRQLLALILDRLNDSTHESR